MALLVPALLHTATAMLSLSGVAVVSSYRRDYPLAPAAHAAPRPSGCALMAAAFYLSGAAAVAFQVGMNVSMEDDGHACCTAGFDVPLPHGRVQQRVPGNGRQLTATGCTSGTHPSIHPCDAQYRHPFLRHQLTR